MIALAPKIADSKIRILKFQISNFRLAAFLLISLAPSLSPAAQPTIEQWGLFELSLPGPTNSNSFLDSPFSAVFTFDFADSAATEITGFYDGDGTYRVRLMPPPPAIPSPPAQLLTSTANPANSPSQNHLQKITAWST